jgi:pseudouridylate synthase
MDQQKRIRKKAAAAAAVHRRVGQLTCQLTSTTPHPSRSIDTLSNYNKNYITYSDEVRACIENQRHQHIVALESTIVAHGMPYPQNYETAKEVENIIRQEGAVPATICILGGVIHIGLTDDELRYVAKNRVEKVSKRDVAAVMALGSDGATTVASTMLLAHLVGIRVFVTGGIGGVHRSFSETMDVSADLVELGKTPMTVVCAGVKSILDIPRTLEFLETQGVCVAAYQTDEFPAFFYSKSGLRVRRMDSVAEVAACTRYNVEVTGSGMVLGVPLAAGENSEIQQSIEKALAEARDANVTGSAETPFVLQRVQQLTGGESLARNIALVKQNARIGAQIVMSGEIITPSNVPESPTFSGQ